MAEITIIALFDRFDDARSAMDEIVRLGTSADQFSLLANNTSGDHPPPITNPAFAAMDTEPSAESTSDMGIGIGVGAGLGGAIGSFLKLASFAIPGIGPVIAAGPWVPLFMTIGGAFGAAVAALVDQGVPEEDAQLYAEGVRHGGTLLSVRVARDQIHDVKRILLSHDAVDIGQRHLAWRAEGWVGFDKDAQPFTAEQIAAFLKQDAEDDRAGRHRRTLRHYFGATPPVRFAGVSNVTTHFAEDMLKR